MREGGVRARRRKNRQLESSAPACSTAVLAYLPLVRKAGEGRRFRSGGNARAKDTGGCLCWADSTYKCW